MLTVSVGVSFGQKGLRVRIALLSYRSKNHVGGQGVYVRELASALTRAGHTVDVFSGQPYPQGLPEAARLIKVPSLDLYCDENPFHTPPVAQWRDWNDVTELLDMWTAGFGEPRTFSHRVYQLLRNAAGNYDVIHDNQSLGYGIAALHRRGLPVVATVHHPISADRAVELAAATTMSKRFSVKRWYGFVRMQRKVAAQVPGIITVSATASTDIQQHFGVPAHRIHVVPCGVDTELFSPTHAAATPGRIVTIASADTPLKGVQHALRALAHVRRVIPEAHLELVSAMNPHGQAAALVTELGLENAVRCHHNLAATELAKLLASASAVCVPSEYEGFSLPALEGMASGRPVVASAVGALPELVTSGVNGFLVPPAEPERLAHALIEVLRDPAAGAAMGEAGRQIAQERYSWSAVATQTLAAYRRILGVGQPC